MKASAGGYLGTTSHYCVHSAVPRKRRCRRELRLLGGVTSWRADFGEAPETASVMLGSSHRRAPLPDGEQRELRSAQSRSASPGR